jgi:hypothetical protein
MAEIITADTVNGETIKTIEDKVRALPANQGKNDNAMWLLIDAEVASVKSAGHLKGLTSTEAGKSERYDTVVSGINNKHGRA